MNRAHLALVGRMREDLLELEKIVKRVQRAWELARKTGDDFYIDSAALNLHSFYTGFEVLFELIATSFDTRLNRKGKTGTRSYCDKWRRRFL